MSGKKAAHPNMKHYMPTLQLTSNSLRGKLNDLAQGTPLQKKKTIFDINQTLNISQ